MASTEAASPASPALLAALRRAARDIGAPDDFEPGVERPADPAHGDLASNAALVLARALRRRPRDIAEDLAARLDADAAGLASVEVAGPGFLNFRLDDGILWRGLVASILAGDGWGRTRAAAPEKINVEFVSANPTGPLHVAHGRGAAIGDAAASLLEWTGHEVCREFYVNDAGRQIELLGRSVAARLAEAEGREAEIPEGGYLGDYVADIAARIAADAAAALPDPSAPERDGRLADLAAALLREEQEADLAAFGVRFDRWASERSLFAEGQVEALLSELESRGGAYRADGALWLRTSAHGDEKDRVLVKSDGSHTYFASDIAYHLDKKRRGFDRAIDVWGADHHGHVARMRAALAAGGVDPDFLEVLILQLVTVLRDGAEVRMSKRAGTFVTLRELLDETGPDVARYFFLMRRAEVPMTFDLDLALDTSEKNPVYKVQYAHARMCRIFERGGVDPAELAVDEAELAALRRPAERRVAKTLLRLPEVVAGAAAARAPYQVCAFLDELAGAVNAWYHEGNVDPAARVLADGPARRARLSLADAARRTLRQGLRVLGISAPEQMWREEEAS
ncbi:MAG: arginine--tRNA ligase [Gemmatimonadota bacterium]|nr:arginine--tRNA ligase [Gemmatimonadota bacterium]